ncbi:MAG: hypothetical protein IPP64_12395 [Bacteroidetes bacterium]|nr:hypothetical protein [Bacteroidota bacterium]
MQILDKINISLGTISIQEEGILRFDIDSVDEITLQNLKEHLEVVKALGNGKSFCNLVVLTKFIQVGDDARKFAASKDSNMYTLADAFVINSVALKIVGNFYIRYNKPVRPTRLFTDESEALRWLRTFL